jgi:hypothetical protein
VAGHKADLPFVGFACGRHDGWATWQENIDMVKALTASHHGFAFAWNNGGHSEGGRPMQVITRYYPAELFARNRSYPALGNSSLDNKMGNGDAKDGDVEGGINLGFRWNSVGDEVDRWSVRLANELVKDEMTVDVTPRRCQKFQAKPGERFKFTTSTGGEGEVTADKAGLLTLERVKIRAGVETALTISR